MSTKLIIYFEGLVQDCSISSELAVEILQSCTMPSIWWQANISISCIECLFMFMETYPSFRNQLVIDSSGWFLIFVCLFVFLNVYCLFSLKSADAACEKWGVRSQSTQLEPNMGHCGKSRKWGSSSGTEARIFIHHTITSCGINCIE